ncbi:hypothetical protein GCM10010228_47340 [Streptomyces massasporeus]|nr:hypothetical protein GCM10010228_47340 [Streptomyces massasporeus]
MFHEDVPASGGLDTAPGVLRMEQAVLPQEAFFGPAESAPVAEAAGGSRPR